MTPSTDDTLKHALIGAVVSLATFFLPFSPAVGGGVAGYLHGDDVEAGAKVGGLSGVLAAIPGAVVGTLIASIFVIVGPGQRSGILFALAFFVVVLAVAVVYGGVLGAVGGFVGSYLNGEFAGPTETDPERLRDPTTLGEDDDADKRGEDDAADDDAPSSEVAEFDESTDDTSR